MPYEVYITQEILNDPLIDPSCPYNCAIAEALNLQDPDVPTWVDIDTIFSGDPGDECESYMSELLIEWHNNYMRTGTAKPITIVIDGDIAYIKDKERYDHTTDWKVIPL